MKFRQTYLMYTNCPPAELVATQKLMENLCYFTFMFTKIYCVFPGRNTSDNVVFYIHSKEGDPTFLPKWTGDFVDYELAAPTIEPFSNKIRVKIPLRSNAGEYKGLLVCEQEKDWGPVDRGYLFEKLVLLVEEGSKISDIFSQSLIPDGIMLFNNKGQAIFFSHVTTLILSRLNIKAESIKKYGFPELFQGLGETEEALDNSVCSLRTVGKKGFKIALLNIPVFHRGDFAGNLLIISDVTSQMRYEKELQAKAPIIQEIHHRVKNNLQTVTSLLRLQMRRDKSRPVVRVLTESINRIISIALIHEALSKEEVELVNIKDSLRDLLQAIISNMVELNKDIRGEIRGQDVFMTANQASNVSLCVTEMVQNAIQHAFSYRSNGMIRISVEQGDQEVTISVEDNGSGISPASISGKSLGLQIIRTITQESLGGSFSIEGHRYGTLGRIVIPKSC